MKNIYVSGQTGFIGQFLTKELESAGYLVTPISRSAFKLKTNEFVDFLSHADIIINLAGAPILKRWTKKYKNELISSRIFTTRKLVQAIGLMERKPKQFISVSAVGIYGEDGLKTETSEVSTNSFLGKLVFDWENEALGASNFTKVAVCRMGIVIGKNGGALQKMLPFFKRGLGGKIGNGKQVLSWIHIVDAVRAYLYIMENELEGVFNITAPNAVSNSVFTKILASSLNRPAVIPVPVFMLKLMFGQAAVVLSKGQEAYPKNLLNNNFSFVFPDLHAALNNILK